MDVRLVPTLMGAIALSSAGADAYKYKSTLPSIVMHRGPSGGCTRSAVERRQTERGDRSGRRRKRARFVSYRFDDQLPVKSYIFIFAAESPRCLIASRSAS